VVVVAMVIAIMVAIAVLMVPKGRCDQASALGKCAEMAQKLGTKALAGQWPDGCPVRDRQPKLLTVTIKSGKLPREGIGRFNHVNRIDS